MNFSVVEKWNSISPRNQKSVIFVVAVGAIVWLLRQPKSKKNYIQTAPISRLLRLLNYVDYCTNLLGFTFIKFGENEFRETAKEIVKNTDEEIFGAQGDYLEGVEKFIKGIKYNQITATGKLMLNDFVLNSLKARKEVIEYIQSHKEVLQSKIEKPIIITGLSRSGSTLLYHLLSLDPLARSPRFFEMSQMCSLTPPCSSLKERNSSPRIDECAQRFINLDAVMPGLFKEVGESHYSNPNEIEEDVLVFFHNMMVDFFEALSGSEYKEWYEREENKSFAYLYHYRFFQLLNHYWKPTSHWVLKAPLHAFYLETMKQQYPDARIVFTHRDPLRVVPSFAKLNESYLYWNYRDNVVDKFSFGAYWKNSLLLSANRLLKFSNLNHAHLNVYYNDLVDDPIGTVKRIYTGFGLEVSAEHEAYMKAWLSENPQGVHGRKKYSLEEYGFKASLISKEFAEYTSFFSVPCDSSS